jgi:predicted O-methyltransferase YrrM
VFHDIPQLILERMRQLEQIDRRDRVDGTQHLDRLRQVPPETGRFLALAAAGAPSGAWIEIGTSAGYSALWLSLACRETGNRLVTHEVLPEKVELARLTIEQAAIGDVIELVHGDGLAALEQFDRIAFCFLDADKQRSTAYFNSIVPRLLPGALFLVDNATSHAEKMAEMLALADTDPRLDSVVVPVGKGVLLCRRSDTR